MGSCEFGFVCFTKRKHLAALSLILTALKGIYAWKESLLKGSLWKQTVRLCTAKPFMLHRRYTAAYNLNNGSNIFSASAKKHDEVYASPHQMNEVFTVGMRNMFTLKVTPSLC